MREKKKPRVPPISNGSLPNKPGTEYIVSTNKENPVISFEHFNKHAECASTWLPTEMKSLFDAFVSFCSLSWEDVIKTGGKDNNKTGLGYTVFHTPPIRKPPRLSQDIQISEVRVSQKGRFFGGRLGRIYYIVQLDRNHNICS